MKFLKCYECDGVLYPNWYKDDKGFQCLNGMTCIDCGKNVIVSDGITRLDYQQMVEKDGVEFK